MTFHNFYNVKPHIMFQNIRLIFYAFIQYINTVIVLHNRSMFFYSTVYKKSFMRRVNMYIQRK